MYKIITPHELLIRLLPSTYAVHVVAGLTGAMCVWKGDRADVNVHCPATPYFCVKCVGYQIPDLR